jgi:thioredoxin-dependent peroxiredoxin
MARTVTFKGNAVNLAGPQLEPGDNAPDFQGLKGLGDKVASYTVSLDLPFAQGRFCTAEKITSMQTISDTHNHSFGKNWGVLIESGLPLQLLARSVFVVDKNGKITYVEYVPEVTKLSRPRRSSRRQETRDKRQETNRTCLLPLVPCLLILVPSPFYNSNPHCPKAPNLTGIWRSSAKCAKSAACNARRRQERLRGGPN